MCDKKVTLFAGKYKKMKKVGYKITKKVCIYL